MAIGSSSDCLQFFRNLPALLKSFSFRYFVKYIIKKTCMVVSVWDIQELWAIQQARRCETEKKNIILKDYE